MIAISAAIAKSSPARSEFALQRSIRALKEHHLDGAVTWTHQDVFLPPHLKEEAVRKAREQGGDHIKVWMGFGAPSFFPLPAVFDGITFARAMNMRLGEHTMENVQEQRDFAAEFRGQGF